MGERKNIPPPPGFEPQATQFPVRRHTQLLPRRDKIFLPLSIYILLSLIALQHNRISGRTGDDKCEY